MLITFEGIDGVGKTTQSSLLASYLIKILGHERVVLTQEPYMESSLRAVFLNSSTNSLTDLFAFLALRREHFLNLIKPSLNENKIVICDRFIDSTTAYQGYGYNINLQLINELNSVTTDGVLPNITFILNKNDAQKKATVINKYEKLSDDFYSRVSHGYHLIAQQNSKRCCLIDSSATAQKTHNHITLKLHSDHLPGAQ